MRESGPDYHGGIPQAPTALPGCYSGSVFADRYFVQPLFEVSHWIFEVFEQRVSVQ